MVELEETWKKVLHDELESERFAQVATEVRSAYSGNETIYPPPQELFKAFELCPFPQVKVVIVGQDPYHGKHQANGLAFSVHSSAKVPPSLRNIYKEIENDTGRPQPPSGNLERWSVQGVLLLNATLTVEDGKPGSHHYIGWNFFTDAVIEHLSAEKEHVVFLLWGRFAIQKSALINATKHCVLTAPHPSPYSAHTGFFGSKHFSKANSYLIKTGQSPIEW